MAEFSGRDFGSLLFKDNVPNPASLVGLVKKGESENFVLFSFGSCETWISIPTSIINTVEILGEQKCCEHTHVFVRLSLVEFSTDEEKALAELLYQAVQVESFVRIPVPDKCSICKLNTLYYLGLIPGLTAAKNLGLIRNKDECKSIAGDAAKLTGLLVEAGLNSSIAGQVANALAGRCGRCGCDDVF